MRRWDGDGSKDLEHASEESACDASVMDLLLVSSTGSLEI